MCRYRWMCWGYAIYMPKYPLSTCLINKLDTHIEFNCWVELMPTSDISNTLSRGWGWGGLCWLVPTMHKEALTLTDASLTKSDGSASLLLSHRIDFQSNPFLSQYFDNIIGDIFSHSPLPQGSIDFNTANTMDKWWENVCTLYPVNRGMYWVVQCTMYILSNLKISQKASLWGLGKSLGHWQCSLYSPITRLGRM